MNTKRDWERPGDHQVTRMVDEDGVEWHRLDCRYRFGDWIEQHDRALWKVHGRYHLGQYWVHEKLFGYILLRGL